MIKHYFKSDNVTLYQDDSINIMSQMKDNSIDMIFADPPYFLSSGTFTVKNGKRASVKKGDWDLSGSVKENFDFHLKWIEQCYRILKTGGTIWISGTYHSIYQCGFALQVNDFKILNDISWFKPNAAPNISCRFFTASHETLIWARKGEKTKHTFNYQDMKNGIWAEDPMKKPEKQMRSVWSIPTTGAKEKTQGKHPTQKPMNLLKRIILASTNENDIILDPFNGSGTTGIIASMHNRQYIGIDKEQEFLDLTIKRLNNQKV